MGLLYHFAFPKAIPTRYVKRVQSPERLHGIMIARAEIPSVQSQIGDGTGPRSVRIAPSNRGRGGVPLVDVRQRPPYLVRGALGPT